MAWAPLPAAQPAAGWWVGRETAQEFETRQWAAERIRAKERAKQIRRLRRQAERVSEACLVALGRDEARRHLRSIGMHGPY